MDQSLQGRNHGVRVPPPLGPEKHYILRVSSVKLRDLHLWSPFLTFFLCERTEEACRMIKSLRKAVFFAPYWPLYRVAPVSKDRFQASVVRKRFGVEKRFCDFYFMLYLLSPDHQIRALQFEMITQEIRRHAALAALCAENQVSKIATFLKTDKSFSHNINWG